MAEKSTSNIYDVITVIFVVLTVLVAGLVVLIVNDPNSAINPLPPPPTSTIAVLPTLEPSATPTDTPPPTATPTVTPTITPTYTPSMTPTPTDTPTPTPTNTPVVALPADPAAAATTPAPLDDGSGGSISDDGPLPSPPAATLSPFPFTVAEIRYEANTNEQGCQWLSIAGLLTDMNGAPVPGLAVEINGENFKQVLFSGSASRWGSGGFEFVVGAAPRTASYTLRVIGPTGGPVSDVITVETGNTCQRNVAIVEFIQNHPY